MIVSNNTLLNILIPNDNKALKNVLQQADAQQLSSSSKGGSSVQDIIKNLFSDTINGTKSNETIQNLLKNSNVFKNMGNFTAELKNLQSMIKQDPTLSKFEPVIKTFLLNMQNLDNNTLKEQLGKSGVFLESKLSDTLKTNNLPNKLENTLLQLKQELSNINTTKSKEISGFIDKMLTTKTHTPASLSNDLNNLLNNIKNIPELKNAPQIQNLVNLTSQLKSLGTEAQLLGKTVQNSLNSQGTQNVDTKAVSQNQTVELKNNPVNQIKELLTNIKQQLSQVDLPKVSQLTQEINNILSQKNVPMQTLLNQTKALVSQLQNFIINQPSNPTFSKMSELTNSLKMLSYNTQPTQTNVSLDSSVANTVKNSSTPSTATNNPINQTNNPAPKINEMLTSIKQALATITSPKAEALSQNINNLQTQSNTMPTQSLLNAVKTVVSQLQNFTVNQPASPAVNNLAQLTNSLRALAFEPQIQMTQTLQTQAVPTPQPVSQTNINPTNIPQQTTGQNIQNEVNITTRFNDTLNAIKSELLNNNLPMTKNAIQIIDKFLSQPALMQNPSAFQSSLNELLTTIKTIITNIPTQSNLQPAEIYRLINQLENSIRPDSPLLSQKSLELNPQMQKSNISNDVKSILLKIADEIQQQPTTQLSTEATKQVDKLLTQVDYYQLMSLTSSTNYVYFPFIWDMLEDGSLSMKKLDEEKFYVEINLQLKQFGKINLLLVMYDKNHLDISIFAQKQTLKDEVSEHLQGLKRSLSSVGIVPGTIKLLDLKEEDEKKEENIYTNSENDEQLGFGVNIKV